MSDDQKNPIEEFDNELNHLLDKHSSNVPALVLAQALMVKGVDCIAIDARQFSSVLIEKAADQIAEALTKRGITPPKETT
jgi:hypothetical protein